MSPAVDITGDSIENNAIIINEEDDFLAVTHKASGTRLLVDRNTDLSDLWDAFDQGIETSEFWQDDGSGIAELLSQYNGINTPSVKTDSIDSEGDLNIQSNSDLNQNDIKNAGSVEVDAVSTESLDSRSGYQNVTSSRSVDTTETNTSGSDMNVIVTLASDASDASLDAQLSIDGLNVDFIKKIASRNDEILSLSGTVPAGSTYGINDFSTDVSINRWVEQT